MLIPLRLSALSDEQLMQRASRGSQRAFEELYNRHARRLQGFFVRRLGGDQELAADLMHDTFLRLYDARERYREGQSLRAWLYTIAYNLCKNHMRRPQPHSISLGPSPNGDEGACGSRTSDCIDDDADVEVELDEAAFRDALRQVLRSLPEPYAMLFSLHYEEELTIPQIAQITSLPEGTVKSRMHKTMNIIKQNLKQYENR
ncbi:MAG: RNA polymerase sigma factor [Prevotella sp.]|nr:RNA polymerase sigma factor [Prevotella sp.]